MFNKHLLKVLAGFCGMILLGLITLVIFDSLKDKESTSPKTSGQSSGTVTFPDTSKTTPKTPAPVQKK